MASPSKGSPSTRQIAAGSPSDVVVAVMLAASSAARAVMVWSVSTHVAVAMVDVSSAWVGLERVVSGVDQRCGCRFALLDRSERCRSNAMSTIALIAAGAGGVETIRAGLVEPLLREGHTVAVTVTPTAAAWLRETGEHGRLEQATGLPVRDLPRLPSQAPPHPPIDVYVAAPLTAGSTAKLALGIADNQALTVLTEAIGTPAPMVVFPRINAAHARHPAWSDHLTRLRSAGVDLLVGDDVWPLAEPREADTGGMPWGAILTAVQRHLG
jgi:Flavoprotein